MTDQPLRIAIVGGGAMGSIYASLLAQSRHEVWLIDIWREQIEAIRTHGLRVDGPGGLSRVVWLNATTCADDVGRVDLAILAVKAFATEAGAATIGQLLVEAGIAITMQNGLAHRKTIPSASLHRCHVGPIHRADAGCCQVDRVSAISPR